MIAYTVFHGFTFGVKSIYIICQCNSTNNTCNPFRSLARSKRSWGYVVGSRGFIQWLRWSSGIYAHDLDLCFADSSAQNLSYDSHFLDQYANAEIFFPLKYDLAARGECIK